jgi:hypothetical protein
LYLPLFYSGTRSYLFEDTDDDEHNPTHTRETQTLLTTEDQVPRYLTASPCKKKYFVNKKNRAGD